MPITVQPDLIEQSDFSGGWSPDQEPVALDPKYLQDVLNLLIEPVSGSLVTRKGYTQKTSDIFSGYYVQQLFKFHDGSDQYLMAIFQALDGTSGQYLYAIKVSNWSYTFLASFNNDYRLHWGVGIQGVWYGGVRGENMYAWEPGNGYFSDASTFVTHTAYNGTTHGINYAWQGNELITNNGNFWRPKNNQYDEWVDTTDYVKGQLVTSDDTKTYVAKQDHTASGTKPQSDSTNWSKFGLGEPKRGQAGWEKVANAAKTSVGAWHGERLWLRYDNSGDKSRLQFSAPLKFKKGQDISELYFDPADFAPGNDYTGSGGGWINVNDGKSKGQITALHSYGQYLIIFKRQACWVLSGLSEESFNLRKLSAGDGCVGPEAVCEHNGLVYFLDDDGLKVTDGTAVEDVQGLDNIREWFRDRLDTTMQYSDGIGSPTVWSYGPYVWISIPDYNDSEPFLTIVYHPETSSFWKLDLPVQNGAHFSTAGVEHLYFGTYADSRIHLYTGDVDDDGQAGEADIAWNMTTPWWPFGVRHTERRIRRVWAVVKGAVNYVLNVYRDWDLTTAAATTNRTVVATGPVHIEGQTFADSHAIAYDLAGDAAPAVVYGLAVDTEHRRTRYHVA